MPDFQSAIPKQFDPHAAESRLYAEWEKNGRFDSSPQSGRESYCILLPPPNVTGTLHMGHAFQHTLMDALIRHRRMRGQNTLWQAGTDHAGIATQIVVTRELEREGINSAELSRDEFLRHVWKWKEHSGSVITRQMRRLGASCDWSRERFTMDDSLSKTVAAAFVQLHREGLIYRGKRLVNWDPVLLTAVSDLEVAAEEEDGKMYHVRYPFTDDESKYMVIATTRPETILVDGALAVHPNDSRFKNLIGRRVWVPMTEPRRAIEIIADEHVDPEFGSGCVKISAAHDFDDYQVYLRHSDKNIPLIVLFTLDAKMNENAPPRYRGLDRYEARRRMVEDFKQAGLLVKVAPHRYKLPRGDRSGAVVEPMLTDQWFVKMQGLAELGLEAARKGEVKFTPPNWRVVYEQWLHNIQDWCISRQLVWGHQIPAWHCADGKIIVAHNEEEARELAGGGGGDMSRDPDVLDTWFSSALWPFSTLDWPDKSNPHFRSYFPTSVLVTGFDIIFFWVARMVMMTKHFVGEAPFREVYITGLVRDSEGDKMSKSKGNILDPLDLIDGASLDSLVQSRIAGLMNPNQAKQIEQATRRQFPRGIPSYGADALRFTFASLASHGRDIKFDLSRCEGYRNFCNKLWNAARFVLGVCADFTPPPPLSDDSFSFADRWIISRLQRAESAVAREFANYRFDLLAQAIYQLVWDEYCDWYVEAAKVQLKDGDANSRLATQQTLLRALEAILRLAHPLIPFITEELWQKVAPLAGVKNSPSLMLARYPESNPQKINEDAERKMNSMMKIIDAVRRLRSESGIAPSARIPLMAEGDRALFSPYLRYVPSLARVSEISFGESNAALPSASAEGFRLSLNVQIDREAERARIAALLSRLEKEAAAVSAKLENPEFIAKAPAAVVAKRRMQLDSLIRERDGLREEMSRL